MAAVEVTISGVLYDKLNRTTQQVVLVGEGSLTGLGVGGGPMPPGPGQPGQPPGIWGPPGPWPTPPIQMPPGTWPPQRPPHPAHPIVNPTPPTEPPPVDPPTDPPSVNWAWGYSPTYESWVAVYLPGEGQAGPKA